MIQSANNHLPIFNNVLFWFHVLALPRSTSSIYPYPVWGSPYQSADHYWPMYNITDGILEDVEGAAHTVVYNGGKTVQVAQLGSALVLDGQDDWVDTGRSRECSSLPSTKFGCGFNADCVTNPSTCTEGFTMTFWLKVYSSGYVMSSGSFTNHRNGPGYRLFYKQRLQRFEFLLETKQKRWTLLLHEEVGLWTHMAFTWRDQSGLSYYEDGNLSTYTNKPIFLSPLRQQNYTPVITLARPNNLMRVREFGKFEISQFAIWLKELSAEDIAGVYARGVTYDQKFTFCCHFKSVSPCVTDPCYDADKCRKISQSNEKKCICPAVNLQLKTCTAKITGDCEDKSSNCGRYAKQSRYCQHRKMRETCPRSCSYCAPPDFGSTIAAPTLITGSSSVSRVARDSNNHFTVEPMNARPMGQTSTKPTLPPGEGCGSECGSNVSLATTMRPGYVSTRRRMPRGESCDTLECSYYAHCEMTSYGYAECRCPETCAVEYAPVCGSDEKTYLNMCVLKLESCHTGEWVEKTKQGTCTPYGLAAHYWPLNGTTKDKQVLDIRGNSSGYAYGEGQSQAEQLGTVISLDGTDDFIGANDIKEKCIVDPTYCTEGLSVAFWLKYTKGEFIISGGRYISSDHGPGFRFVHQGKGPQAGSSGKYLLEISTKTQRWKLLLESIPKWWFHFAFTWSKMQGLRLYVNGKHVMSRTKPDPVKRPFAGKIPNDLTIGRPNSMFKMNSYGQFSIGHLVIWTNSLSSFDVRVAFVILLSKTLSSMVCCNRMKGDPCITNPCQNGATCQRMDDKYQCVCPDVIGDCSRKRNVPEPCEDSESVECEKLASQEGYCQYHWRRMRNICPKACKFCGIEAPVDPTKDASSSSSFKIDAQAKTAWLSGDGSAGTQSAIGNHNVPSVSGGRHQIPFTSPQTNDRSKLTSQMTPSTSANEEEATSRTTHQMPDTSRTRGTIKPSRHQSHYQSSTSREFKTGEAVSGEMKYTLSPSVSLSPSPDMQKISGSSTRRTSNTVRDSSVLSPHKIFSGSGSSLTSHLHVTGVLLKSDDISRDLSPGEASFLSHYSTGLTTQARKTLNSSSSTAQFLPQVSPSYTSSAIESFAKSTTTRHDFSTKADTRSTLARTTHIAQASSVISSVTASEKTSSPCKVNNVNCTCFSCDETRRRGDMLACCVDLIEPKTIQNGASIQLVGLTAQEVSERLSITSRIIAEVVRESCTMRDCVINPGSAARRKRRSQQDQSKWSNSSSSSENLRASSEDESRYQDNSDSSITQTSQKSLKRSTSVNKEALRPEVNPSNINISRVNTIIYRIASDPPTVQTAFYVTMTTINNGTNQTQVLDGNVLLQILRDKRHTLENRLNVTIDSISAWQAASTKETTTSGLLLPNPTPGSHGHETSLASSAAPTTVVVGRVEGQGAKGLSETVFIVIMCSAIGGLVLLIIVLVYLFTRFYRGRKGEFVPDKSYPHNQTKQEDDPGENGEAIPSFVDPSTPRITDVPHKPTRAESNARNAAGKKKKPMGVKITYKPPKWD